MASYPLVTVGMAVYNGEKYIAEAISSVLAETYANWELLLVNDRSPDSSVDVIRQFTDPRIRLIENETNLGLVGVRNRILEEASGTYVAWLDQDDLTLPARLTAQVAFLEANPDYAMCGSWTETRIESLDGSVRTAIERLPRSHDEIRAALLFLNPIACNTATMRRADFLSRGLLFRPAFGNSLDYDMWSLASDDMLLCNLPQVLGAYRVHASQTSQGAALAKMNDHEIQIQSDLAARALGLEMTDEDRRVHRLATLFPILVDAPEDIDRVAQWFARLRSANQVQHGFEVACFDRALARQWTSVVLGALGSGASLASVVAKAYAGLGTIGISKRALGSSLSEGVRRRLARRG